VHQLTYVDGRGLFFVAADDAHGVELWQGGHTTAPALVRDLAPESRHHIQPISPPGGALAFTTNPMAAHSSGSHLERTVRIQELPLRALSLTVSGDYLFLTLTVPGSGRDLWAIPRETLSLDQPALSRRLR
jgi:ELWxxDGT repeat protein